MMHLPQKVAAVLVARLFGHRHPATHPQGLIIRGNHRNLNAHHGKLILILVNNYVGLLDAV